MSSPAPITKGRQSEGRLWRRVFTTTQSHWAAVLLSFLGCCIGRRMAFLWLMRIPSGLAHATIPSSVRSSRRIIWRTLTIHGTVDGLFCCCRRYRRLASVRSPSATTGRVEDGISPPDAAGFWTALLFILHSYRGLFCSGRAFGAGLDAIPTSQRIGCCWFPARGWAPIFAW